MLGMGPMEIAVILVVALIIFGPGKLPEIAQTAGRAVRDFRSATQDLTGDFQQTMNELQETADDFKKTALDFQHEAEATITGVQSEITGAAKDFEESTSAIAAEVGESIPLDQMDSAATRPSPKVEAQIAAAREELRKPQPGAKSSSEGSTKKKPAKSTGTSASKKTSSSSASKSKSGSKNKARASDEQSRKTKKRRQREPAAVTGAQAPSKEDPLADLMGVDDGPILSSRSRSNGRRRTST